MTVETFLPGPGPHRCDLPHDYGMYGGTGCPNDTIAQCLVCGRAWFSAPCFETYGPVTHWRRIRPWHWRLRRRLAASLAAS